MAAQARHYESKIYSSRQVEDKIISKNHRHNSYPKSSSRESSPYRVKNNSHLSPIGRKRSHDSPVMKHGSPYSSSRKKERMNNDSHKLPIDDNHSDSEWSQHLSSSGKVYYYNKRTEESQWELPKDWIDRDKKYNDRYCKDRSRNTRDEVNNKDQGRDNRDGNRYKEKRDYRDSRMSKELNSSSSSLKDRSFRERDSRDLSSSNGKYRSNSGSSRSSSSVKSDGQITPSAYTSSNNRSYHLTPDSVNGTVQDISPPGTPTNDDTNVLNISNISNISNVSPASSMFTPHPCSPLLNTSMSALASAQLGLSTSPHNSLLSSNILLNAANPVTSGLLHPLQQALLLHQQQQQQQQLSNVLQQTKELYGSPKLPTVKNHFNDVSASSPSSPLVTNFHHNNINSIPHSSPSTRSLHSNSSTPPPPPPPPKDLHYNNEIKHDRFHRNNSSFDGRLDYSRDVLSRSKSYDSRLDNSKSSDRIDETLHRSSSQRLNDSKYNSERQYKKSLHSQKPVVEQESMFGGLPELDKYTSFYSASVVDFTNNFYGNALDKQSADVWHDVMGGLHTDGHRTKYMSTLSTYSSNLHHSKLDVSSNWYDALDRVLLKVESLRDSNMSTTNNRDYKTSLPRKSKHDNTSTSVTTTTTMASSSTFTNETVNGSQQEQNRNNLQNENKIKDKPPPPHSDTS